MQNYTIEGTILSPVHIGAGRELTPFDYVIKDKNLICYRLEEVLADLAEQDTELFYQLNDSGNINGLRQFIAERVDETKHAYYTAPVTDRVASRYNQKIKDIENQLIISPMIRDPLSFRPYIPGSSIKGAMRTAVVSELSGTTGGLDPNDRFLEKEIEWKILKYGEPKRNGPGITPNMGKDPFRCISIRDIFFKPENITIAFIRNMGKDRNGRLNAIGIQMIHEVLNAQVMNKPVTFSGSLVYNNDVPKKNGISRNDIIPEYLISACNAFYKKKIKEESERFYEDSSVDQASEMLLKEINRLQTNECLVRVGRFCGAECMTVDGFRKIRKIKGPTSDKADTRNICEEKYPMGWVKLKIAKA